MNDQLARLKEALKDTYAVERQVGAGGMATVYLARDLKHGRAVAIKVLRPELSASVGTDRFLREIEMAARLQHPHILAVYDSGAAAGLLYYVMPFVEGESLRDRMDRDGKLPVEETIRLAREIASALDYAHSHGVVHRDIKPENILLFGGHAVVADFGVARAVETGGPQLTGMGIAIGTPSYMSPEQATAETEIDGRSDQYSLACVIYEMLTAERAFGGPTVQSVITRSISGPRPRARKVRPDVPETTDAALVRALDQDPGKRFATANAFTDALETSRSGAYEAAARGSRRWMGIAAVAMLLLAGFVGWTALRGRPPVVEEAQRIAVLPFRTSGADVELLGEGLVDLLSTNLDGVGGINTVEPRTVLQRWKERGSSAALDDALAVAADVDAGAVLLGSVVQTGSAVRLSADLYARDGSKLGHAQVDGPADSVLGMVDALSLSLMREVWRSNEPLPSLKVATLTTTSPAAMRDYLRGEQYYRQSRWDSAAAAFRDAVSEDSTFALAHYRLATTYGWTGNADDDEALEAGAAAVRFVDRLPVAEQTIVRAYRLFQLGDTSATDSMRRYTAEHPDDADGWYLLGESQFHRRDLVPMPVEQLLVPFDRVLALDSSLAPAAIHSIEMAMGIGDRALYQRYLHVLEASNAETEADRFRSAGRLLFGDGPVDSAFGEVIASQRGDIIFGTVAAIATDPNRSADARIARLDQVLDSMPADGPVVRQLRGVQAMVLAGLGRLGALREQISTGQITGEARFMGPIVPVINGFAPPGYADSLTKVINRETGSAGTTPRQLSSRNPYELYYRALFFLGQGKTADGVRILEAAALKPADSIPAGLAELMDAARGLAQVQQGDTAAGVARMRAGLAGASGKMGPPPSAPIRFHLALALAARPGTREEGILRLRHGFAFDPHYDAIRHLALGRALEAKGDYAASAEAYTRYIALWEGADPEFQPQVTEAREALARVQRAGG